MTDNYIGMLQQSIDQGRLLARMTSGVITLLFKEGDHANLSNWWPIILFNVSYKVLAKSLQFRLYSIFQKVISLDQFAFLPHVYSRQRIIAIWNSHHKVFLSQIVTSKITKNFISWREENCILKLLLLN